MKVSALGELVRGLGGAPEPASIRQQQFDGDEKALKRLARTRPGEPVRLEDLMSWCDDLRYVSDLQEDLLRRVLPHALNAWRENLATGDGGGFDESLWAALARRREFLARTLGAEGTRAAARFMAEGLLERMAAERTLAHRGSAASPYCWSQAFVSFGCAWDEVELVLAPWRAMGETGLALCATQYLASLVYDENDNPVFAPWTKDGGGGPITPWENASIGFDELWSSAAVERLKTKLTGAAGWLAEASIRLKEHPDRAVAEKVAADAASRGPRLQSRATDLCRFLAAPSEPGLHDWTSES